MERVHLSENIYVDEVEKQQKCIFNDAKIEEGEIAVHIVGEFTKDSYSPVDGGPNVPAAGNFTEYIHLNNLREMVRYLKYVGKGSLKLNIPGEHHNLVISGKSKLNGLNFICPVCNKYIYDNACVQSKSFTVHESCAIELSETLKEIFHLDTTIIRRL